jgi:uncharacterized repeat protein (TIGR01451 family)
VGTSPAAVVVADFNSDGKPDIAVANSGSGNVNILLNNGDGTFKPTVNFDAGMTSPTFIDVSDFNQDGIQDLAIWSLSLSPGPVGSTLSILLGNGDGTFQAPKTTALPAPVDQYTLDLAIADFNLDHKPDLAVLVHDTNGGAARILLLAGNGDGTFKAAQPGADSLSTVVGGDVTHLVAADFNRDATPDLAAVQGAGGVQILLGQGDGTFHAGATIPVASGFAVSDIKLGDFNGDGDVDLLAKSGRPNECGLLGGVASRISLFRGNGDGSFQAEQLIAKAAYCKRFNGEHFVPYGSRLGAPSTGDFNADGRPDLLYAASDSPAAPYAGIYLGRADGAFSVPVSLGNGSLGSLDPFAVTFIAQDLNGDKLSDLIYLDPNNNAVVVLQNTSPTSGADLGILAATAGPSSDDGRSISYEADVLNAGPDDASGVTLTAALSNGVNFVSATATQGTCSQSGGTVTCTIGSLTSGFDAGVTVAVTLKPTQAVETLNSSVRVTANVPDLALANNTATPSADVFTLTVSKDGTGSGTVTSATAGIDCGGVCTQGVLGNIWIQLVATAAPGSVFTGWDGAVCHGPATTCGVNNVGMWGSQTVRATFDKAPTPPPPSGGGSGGGGSGGGGAIGLVDLLWMLCLGLGRAFRGYRKMLSNALG